MQIGLGKILTLYELDSTFLSYSYAATIQGSGVPQAAVEHRKSTWKMLAQG